MKLDKILSEKSLKWIVISIFAVGVASVYAVHWAYYREFGDELGIQLSASSFQAKEGRIAAVESAAAAKAAEKEGPIVAYRRTELLKENEVSEKLALREKLVAPLMAHGLATGHAYIAIIITVPEKVGQKYEVLLIEADGSTRDFTFGAREKDFKVWTP